MEKVEEHARKVALEEAEGKKFAAEVEAIKAKIESEAAGQKQQLAELETAIVAAENVIPEAERERFRRTVKQHGADAMAPIEYDRKSSVGACSGCFVLGHDPGAQRAHQRLAHQLLQDLRPDALPRRGRPRLLQVREGPTMPVRHDPGETARAPGALTMTDEKRHVPLLPNEYAYLIAKT